MPRASWSCKQGGASWKPLAKGTSWFSYGYSEETEIPSHPERSEETEESDEQQSAFSFHTQTDLIWHVRMG